MSTGSPSSIVAIGGAQQSTFALTVFGGPLQVVVTDAAGNPVAGVPVLFTAPSSGASGAFGGQLTFSANTDDAQGRAQATITANNTAGSYVVTAASTRVTGFASFSLTNLPLTSTALKFVQQPSNTVGGQVIAPPVKVQVQTSLGRASNTAGVAIVVSLSSDTGTLLGSVVQITDATGTATFGDLRIGAFGPKQLTATASSQAPTVSNTFQITAGPPATIAPIGDTPQATQISTLFPLLLQAQVNDNAGNPVSGVTVTFVAPGSGPSGVFAATPSVVKDNSGVATAPLFTANNLVGSFPVMASVSGVASPALFTLTNLPQPQALTAIPSYWIVPLASSTVSRRRASTCPIDELDDGTQLDLVRVCPLDHRKSIKRNYSYDGDRLRESDRFGRRQLRRLHRVQQFKRRDRRRSASWRSYPKLDISGYAIDN